MSLRRRLTVGLSTMIAVSAFAVSAQASTIVSTNGSRDQSAFTQPGIVYAEGVGGIARYVWYVDRGATEAFLRGYEVDQGVTAQSTIIDATPTEPAGELGRDITGIGFLANDSKLAIADYSNDRVVIYPRVPDGAPDPPVDYAAGESITSVGGIPLLNPTGLAVNRTTSLVYVSIDAGVDGPAIIRFDANTGSFVGMASGFPAGAPAALAVNPYTGWVYAAVTGSEAIQVLDASASGGVGVPSMESGTPGDFTSISVEPNTNRLYAMKPDELSVFSLSTGTLLGTVQFLPWGGENLSVSAIENVQDVQLSSSGSTMLVNLFASTNPVCTPEPPITVERGATLTFTPSCTDADNSTVKEFTVTNSQTLGSAQITPDRAAIQYTAGSVAGQDDIAYRVNTQDGLSVEKHQLINVPAAAAAPTPPAEVPVVRETSNLQLDSGDVFIKLPGSDEFVKLTKDTLIPLGTVIDAREGKAHLTFANADGTTYDGIFWDGIFQVIQGSGDKPIATLKLRDDLVAKASGFATARTTADLQRSFFAYTARRRGKKKNGLWGDAKGKYRTSGKGGTATVRGTRWYVANYTYGSLFKVTRGMVEINPIRGKNFNLKAGKQFFIFYKR